MLNVPISDIGCSASYDKKNRTMKEEMIMNFENDELDAIRTKPTAENSRVPAPPKVGLSTANTNEAESLAIDFNDEQLMKREGLELCRPDQDRKVRFTMLCGDANPGIVNPQGA